MSGLGVGSHVLANVKRARGLGRSRRCRGGHCTVVKTVGLGGTCNIKGRSYNLY